jgi:hypothetical protein
MVVDDASMSSTGTCQVESWTQRTQTQTEYWTVPTCKVGGNWELAAGFGRITHDGTDRAYRSGAVQAKTMFRPLEKNDWRMGLTIANQFRQGEGVARPEERRAPGGHACPVAPCIEFPQH